MGKMSLGLGDRSARLIHGRDVWTEIKDLLSGYSNIQAAIASVGSDADRFLPLRGPATIVVNASDEALANGSTDPELLLRWTRRGVRVYSLPSMHAKAVLAEGDPSFVLIGSANVSWSSANRLDEAVLVADERDTVDELRRAMTDWKRLAGEPLTEAWLQGVVERRLAAAPGSPSAAPRPAVQSPPEVPARFASTAPGAPSTSRAAPVVAPAAPRIDPVPEPITAEPITAEPITAEPAPPVSENAEPEPVEPDTESAIVRAGHAEMNGSNGHDQDREDIHGVEIRELVWPRPKYIYLATLTRDGRPSDTARERLDLMRTEFRVPHAGAREPTLEVEMFWWDGAGSKPTRTYREGWHLVPISVPASGRPAVLSQVDSPGLVLDSFTDYLANPARTYYYLLTRAGGQPTTFRKLRETLAAVGEKPSYDHAYMMQHKVDAILGLWPQISYTD